MTADDTTAELLLADLWSLVEGWSSAAIGQARAAATDGSSEVADAEIRMLVAHAAELRAALETHLDRADAPSAPVVAAPVVSAPVVSAPAAAVAAPAAPGTLWEPPRAQVCQECFTMVRLDEVDEHEAECVRHAKIERMDRAAALLDADLAVFDVAVIEAVAAEATSEADPAVRPSEARAGATASESDLAYLRDIPVEVIGVPAPPYAEQPAAPEHRCNSADFERPLCEVCAALHWYCSICGAQQDPCKVADVTPA